MPEKRHGGVHRAFDLSSWAYFLDFALVPIAALALLGFCVRHAEGESAFKVGVALIAGALAWSFAEYWIHRLAFHGHTPFEPMHQAHHALPKDMIGAASWVTFPGFAMVWLAAILSLGWAPGSAITAGLMVGYFFYCAIHVSMHHAGARGFGRYGKMMLLLHRAHHRGGNGNFGVTSPVWDFVFRTYQPVRQLEA